jgi:hypothetical protein
MRQILLKSLTGMFILLLQFSGWGWAETPTVEAILSTPLSSRINQRGYRIKAVSAREFTLYGQPLPIGTTLLGQVTAVESSDITRHSGRIKLVFTHALLPTNETRAVFLIPDTPDGWLNHADTYLSACKIMPGHSTRLLNAMVRRRLPADRAVWGQVLKLNTSSIPDPDTDEFIEEYHRHDVLLGAGDWLRLRTASQP